MYFLPIDEVGEPLDCGLTHDDVGEQERERTKAGSKLSYDGAYIDRLPHGEGHNERGRTDHSCAALSVNASPVQRPHRRPSSLSIR